MSNTEELIRAVLEQKEKEQKEEDTKKLIACVKKIIKEERSRECSEMEE